MLRWITLINKQTSHWKPIVVTCKTGLYRVAALRAGLALTIAAFAGIAATPAMSEEKPTAFHFEILPADKTCLKILPEDDPKLKELKLKCAGLAVQQQTGCTSTGGTVVDVNGQAMCRKAVGSAEARAVDVKLPSGKPMPTNPPPGAPLGTKAVAGPAGGCVLRPGAPPLGAGCGVAK